MFQRGFPSKAMNVLLEYFNLHKDIFYTCSPLSKFPVANTLPCTHSSCMHLYCQTHDSLLSHTFSNPRMTIYGCFKGFLEPQETSLNKPLHGYSRWRLYRQRIDACVLNECTIDCTYIYTHTHIYTICLVLVNYLMLLCMAIEEAARGSMLRQCFQQCTYG